MGKFTDIFICRPVLAVVVSLLIFIMGLRAIGDLPVTEFPKMENTVITVTTSYPGASADLIEGFITTPIEKSMATAGGLDYMTSESQDNVSIIKFYVKLNYDPNSAFTEVMSKVSEVQNVLPKNAEQPVIQKDTGSTTALMYVGFNSDKMTAEQITDYIARVVQPALETVNGVSSADILGAKTFAMRIWLNPEKMASLGVSPSDITQALQSNNFQSAAGTTKGEYVAISLDARTDVQNVEGFKNIIVKSSGNAIVHLRDVAKVELGSEDYDSSVYLNGKKAIFVAINSTPTANPLTVISDVRKILPILQKQFPPTLSSQIVYDATVYIKASLHDVMKTIVEAALIVVIVIFLFLGSLRTILIPIVTIPLSLLGVCLVMLILGYSLNLLTLLAMVLAIGLVVDDAIVVVENIYRHVEEGINPFKAAILGAREIATPVISMTITLAAVYAPIGLMGGITGALFKEFAFTLAASVIISGVIALTLSPMMCSKILNINISKNKLVNYIDHTFNRLRDSYRRRLHRILEFRPVTVVFAILILSSCYFLYTSAQKELAPYEDQGSLFVTAMGPGYANLNYMEKFSSQYDDIYKSFPSLADYFTVNGIGNVTNSVISGFIMKPWDDRKQTQQGVRLPLQNKLRDIAGLRSIVYQIPALPLGGSPLDIQFVLTSIRPLEQLAPLADQLVAEGVKSGLFIILNSSLTYDKPKVLIEIERSKAAQMGISMQSIGNALATAFGENYVNFFSMEGRSYKVIPQVGRGFRVDPKELAQIHLQTASGSLVPLSTFVNIKPNTEPNSLTRFQQLNAVTISGVMMPGQTIGDGLNFLIQKADQLFPNDVGYDYAGQSRQYIQEGSALVFTFALSLVVIFLVLSAQFESFRDPLVILVSVPMSISGALIPLALGIATVNIYTQIGLITLIGLISKHGILMVEFANQLQRHEGLSIRESIEKAAAIRLRPILMTTGAMVMGVVPLLISSGAGAVSRFDIGLVIFCGMLVGTMFTLFVVPTMYTLIARKHKPIPKVDNL